MTDEEKEVSPRLSDKELEVISKLGNVLNEFASLLGAGATLILGCCLLLLFGADEATRLELTREILFQETSGTYLWTIVFLALLAFAGWGIYVRQNKVTNQEVSNLREQVEGLQAKLEDTLKRLAAAREENTNLKKQMTTTPKPLSLPQHGTTTSNTESEVVTDKKEEQVAAPVVEHAEVPTK